jgi:AcrR family transcriptional regulator
MEAVVESVGESARESARENAGESVGLRERKKLKTREDLEQAALELFESKGFDHTTIEEIAEACDVSPRTFFRYFPNKEALLLSDADEKCQLLVVGLLDRPAGESPLRSIRESLVENLAGLEHDRPRMLMQSRIMAETPSLRTYKIERQQSWEEAILQALRTRESTGLGDGRSTFELRLIASTAIAALRAAVETWLDEGGDVVARVDDAFERIAAGLDPAEALTP